MSRKFGWSNGDIECKSVKADNTNKTFTGSGAGLHIIDRSPGGGTGVQVAISNALTTSTDIGINLDLASTGTTSYALKITKAATNAGFFITSGVTTSSLAASQTRAIKCVDGDGTVFYLIGVSTFA